MPTLPHPKLAAIAHSASLFVPPQYQRPAAMTSHHKAIKSDELVKLNGDSLTIKPRALDITWGADPRYWKFSSNDDDSPAELLQVSWLEVNGKASLSNFIPGKEYAVKFKVVLKPDNFGWANQPVYLILKIEKSQRSWKKADLSKNEPGVEFVIPKDDEPLSFKVPEGAGGKMVEFGMYEIWKGRWKGGLVINEVVIEPLPAAS